MAQKFLYSVLTFIPTDLPLRAGAVTTGLILIQLGHKPSIERSLHAQLMPSTLLELPYSLLLTAP